MRPFQHQMGIISTNQPSHCDHSKIRNYPYRALCAHRNALGARCQIPETYGDHTASADTRDTFNVSRAMMSLARRIGGGLMDVMFVYVRGPNGLRYVAEWGFMLCRGGNGGQMDLLFHLSHCVQTFYFRRAMVLLREIVATSKRNQWNVGILTHLSPNTPSPARKLYSQSCPCPLYRLRNALRTS